MQRLVLFFIVLCMLAGGGRALSQPANDDKADALEIAGASGQLRTLTEFKLSASWVNCMQFHAT